MDNNEITFATYEAMYTSMLSVNYFLNFKNIKS